MPGRALIGLLLACTVSAPATAGDDLARAAALALAEGKQLLDAGKDARPAYLRARQLFERSGDGLDNSPGRWRNIGNAAFLAGDMPYAVLCFRLGLMYDPHDVSLRASLEYVRSQVRYPPGQHGAAEVDFWPTWLPRFGSGVWLGIGVVGYLGGCLAATAWWLRRWKTLAAATLVGLAAATVGAYGWHILDRQWQRDRAWPTVVIRFDDVALRTGNGASYPAHAELPALRCGMEARRVASRGDWWQIQFASGVVGWIRDSQAYMYLGSRNFGGD